MEKSEPRLERGMGWWVQRGIVETGASFLPKHILILYQAASISLSCIRPGETMTEAGCQDSWKLFWSPSLNWTEVELSWEETPWNRDKVRVSSRKILVSVVRIETFNHPLVHSLINKYLWRVHSSRLRFSFWGYITEQSRQKSALHSNGGNRETKVFNLNKCRPFLCCKYCVAHLDRVLVWLPGSVLTRSWQQPYNIHL